MNYVEPEPIRVIRAEVARTYGAEAMERINAGSSPLPLSDDEFDAPTWADHATVRRVTE